MSEALRVAVSWTAMLLVASHLGLALAAAGIPCVTAIVGFKAVKRLKIFTDKFGQQASTFALLGGIWACLALAGFLCAVWLLAPVTIRPFFGFPWPFATVVAPLALGALVFLAYRGLWQRLKADKSRHAALGLAATACFWLALSAGIACLRLLAINELATSWATLVCPPAGALFWRVLALCLALSLHLAGTFTAAWLVWRRDKDDFGRDYYIYTMRLAAKLGLWAGVAALVCLGWTVVGLLPMVGELSPRLTTAVELWGTGTLLALGGCGFVANQENPLPYKVILILAFLGSLAALTGLVAGLANVFWPML